MKRQISLLTLATSAFLVLSFVTFSSCTKTGPEGPPGKDGEDGLNADASCVTCHDFSDDLLTKVHQFANSAHGSGANVDRSNEGCAQCHTSQGFRLMVDSGMIAAVSSPAIINCRTCHKIHETYTPADYALRGSGAIAMVMGGPAAEYNYGTSNVCANCHQGRTVTPYPVAGGDPVSITNKRYGPHYGPQSNMFIGKGGYEIDGPMPYSNSPHTLAVTNGCVTCHMDGNPVGLQAGGHQMNITYNGTSKLLTGCTVSGCHTDAAVVKSMFDENRAEIAALELELETALKDMGLLDADGYVAVPATLTQDQLGIILNLKLVHYDHSYGAHNYRYTKALLVNSLAALAKSSV